MNCDAIAPYYHLLERLSFGNALHRTRCTYLNEVKTAHRALLCGDGDGRFLAALLRANPHVEVDFVDLSPRMIQLARRRIAKIDRAAERVENSGSNPRAAATARVRFWPADVAEFVPPWPAPNYDVIVTHFFLDCFCDAELAQLVPRIASWAAPNALWLISDFRESETPLGRLYTHAIIRSLYAAFRLTTGLRVTQLPNYKSALASANAQPLQETNSLSGLLHASLWRLPTRPIKQSNSP
jgi:SAM-dependent methyltransferase